MLKFDMADIKPSVANAIMITLIIIVMVPLTKALVTRFPVPGLTPLVMSV